MHRGASATVVRGLIRGFGSLIAITLGIVALGLLCSSPASAEPACTDTWTGASEGEWLTATNWSTSKVPGSSDVACLGTGTTVKVNGSPPALGVLLSKGSVLIEGGTLEITNTVEGSSTQAMTLRSGTLSGSGTLTISGTLLLATGSTLAGSGKTALSAGGTGTVEQCSGCQAPLLTKRTLVNEGTLTYKGPTEALMSEGSRLENKGTVKLNAAVAHSIAVAEGSTVAPVIVNSGTFEKTEGEFTTKVDPTFENFGTITASVGKIEITKPVHAEESTLWGGPGNPSAPGQPHPMCGKPVSCATGNESATQTDLTVAGRGVGLNLERTYNSQAAAAGIKSTFGYGWTSSFSDHLAVEPTAKLAILTQANGSTVPFSEGGGGGFTAPVWTQDTLSGSKETGYTLTLENQTKYKFTGSSGRLESVTDRNGNATTLTYGGTGRLETITDPAGRKMTLAYNEEGLIESAKDPMGHLAKYSYVAGNLASVIEPGEAEARWRFKYDGSHQLAEATDGRGGKTVDEYDASHRVISQLDPLKHELTFEYTSFETKITNHATGAVTYERFTSAGLPVSITRGFGTASASTESFGYDAANNVLSTTDGNGHTTKYTYDGASNRTSALDPNENETKWTYNATHDVETTTTPKGETTTVKRDANGNAEIISRPAPGSTTQTTSYKYDTHGSLTSVEDPLKRTWKYEYNTQGDRTAEIDPEADKRTWGYNEDSQETSTVSPRGVAAGGAKEAKYKTTIERDAQGRPLLVTAPLKHETKHTYDANGNLATQTDPGGDVTTYTYDADDESTKVEAPDGTITETSYDGAGRVTSQTDGNKHATTYARNVLGQVTEVIDPLSRKTTKEYDAAGNLQSLTDAAKRTTSYKHDPGNRLTEVSYSDGVTPTVKFEYDADGARTKMIDGTGTSKYTYDQLDRLTERKDGHGAVSSYEYDLANERTKVTYPNTKAVTRAYDSAGRLKSVTDWLEHTTKFGYDADSDLTATTFPSTTTNEDSYAYDETDAMSEVKMKKGAELLASLIYVRNKDNQVTKATTIGLPGEEKPAFAYDANDRLTKGAGIAYKYDAADNPTKLGTPTYTYDNASELKTGTGLAYTYDEVGERTKTKPTSGPATNYGYDQAGNLTTVTRAHEGEVSAIEDTYAYDGTDLRSSQTVSGTTSYLAWDAGGTGLPLVLNDGTNSYVYGPGDLPVEQINAEGGVLYLHHDQQGSTRVLTNSSGAVGGTVTYDAYGNKTGATGTSVAPLGYDAQYTSSDTGLIYMRARTYDPATAQFLSVDPMASLTRTLYTYAEDDPLTFGDPTGLWSPTEGLERFSTEIGEGIANVAGGLVNGLTGGLVEGSGDPCTTGYTIGQEASWLGLLLPEDWGIQVYGRVRQLLPKTADLLVKLGAQRRVTEPSNVKIVVVALEELSKRLLK